MNIVTAILFAVTCLRYSAIAKIEVEDGVLVLTKDNFDQAIEENEYIFIEFYAPWCGHCKALAPEFVKAAKQLADTGSNVKLAKVDATIETELAERHFLKGYPTLLFYRKGSYTDYKGTRSAADMVNWLLKKSGPPAKDLTSVEEAKAFIDEHEVAIVGFFKDQTSEAAKVFFSVGSTMDGAFGVANVDEVLKEYEVEDGSIVLFKKFDEGKVTFKGELTAKDIQKFITVYSLPLIVDFNQESAQKIFNTDIKSHLLVFLSREAGHFEKYVDIVKEPAKQFRDEVLFVTLNTDDHDHERILEYLGINKEEIPTMLLMEFKQDMTKYKPKKTEINAENILEFVNDFLEGKLKKHLIMQDLPDDWDKHPVKVLVASNFHEVAFNKDKDVLVEFYAPWCALCNHLAPIYEDLGKKFEDSETVVIAKMDATANELEDIKILEYPTIILYKKETNEAVEYAGARTLDGLAKFVETGGADKQVVEEAQEEDENDDVPRKDEL